MPPSRSSSSQSRTSTPSQNSMSPLNPNEPLTPPEPSTLGQHSRPIPSSDPQSNRYMTRPPLQQSCSYDTLGAGGSGMGYSPSILMPPPSSYPNQQSYGMAMPMNMPMPGTSFSPVMSSPLRQHESPYGEHHNQFASYPQPYPYQVYQGGVSMSQTMSQQSTATSYNGMGTDTDAENGFASMLNVDFEVEDYRQSSVEPNPASPSKTSALENRPPRPPNAWILYRSDKLNEISAGKKVKNLDGVMRDSGVSSSSGEESSAEAGLTSTTSVTDDEKEKPTIRRKGKKGAKEPTEGLLALGKGKTGRGLPQAHISKMISELWKRESATVRGEYERRSEVQKLEHAKKYPNYKFQPQRKADKDRAKEEKAKEKLAAKREKEAKALAARPRKNGTRSRPSTATSPYSNGSRGISRSVSINAIQASSNALQQASDVSLISPPPGFRAFPIPGNHLPSLGTMGPPRSTSRHPSPIKAPEHRSSVPSPYVDQSMPPPPVPSHTAIYDPALYEPEQYHYPQPQYEYQQPQAGPSYSVPEGPFYYDINGAGPAYALPVVYEPPILPDGQNLEALGEWSGSAEELIATWVTMTEDTGDSGDLGVWTMPAPDVAVSGWENLAPETQEQIFTDLDLSHPMALHLTPDLANPLFAMYNNLPADHTPMIDYSSGYISYPIYETTSSQEGPFLYMPQDISPDPTTPRQATFARNPSNIYQPTPSEEEQRVSTSNTQVPTRYVSSSQFPETPLSVDPSGLGGDRRASYANDSLDGYEWANRSDDEDDEEEEVATTKKLEVPSPTKPPLSPISDTDSNIQPLDVPVSVSPQKGVPPRGQRRARTVAGSYH